MSIIDLRSDTVTRPSAGMRAAMAAAEVGDDAYGDDPSVSALEHRIANLLGKEAALFLPSGTMANQLAVAVHTAPGQIVALHPGAHVQVHEEGMAARLSGAQLMPIGDSRTGYEAADLQALIDEESCGWPHVALAWIENTLGLAGGRVWPQASIQAIAETAHSHGVSIHIDGARLWHAAVASGRAVADIAAPADTVSVALSKGLGCPAGSLLVGTQGRIDRARVLRHGLGGGMRQAGVLAAAGLYALDHHLPDLRLDHSRAAKLSQSLADLPCWRAIEPETNIALFEVEGPAEPLCARLRAVQILCAPNRYHEVRLVLHRDIDDEMLGKVIARARVALTA